jgi:hypothetical protein
MPETRVRGTGIPKLYCGTCSDSRGKACRWLMTKSGHLMAESYFSRATTNSGAHSSARLISESGKVQIALRADSA